jgi:AbrB family looped-hinge helix DNA binding protein
MAAVARLRAKRQITLPSELADQLHLEEGDLISFEPTKDGILMRPQKLIDATQAWFWTPRWQAMERQADEDLKAGRYRDFDTDEEFLKSLKTRERVET